MLYGIVVVLVIWWALGFIVFHVSGGLIHILIVVALIMAIYQLATGRRV